MSGHRHARDEDLLQLVLSCGAGRGLQTLESCPTCAARLAQLESSVVRMRGLLERESVSDARKDAALAERIVGMTTPRRRTLLAPARASSSEGAAPRAGARRFALAAAAIVVAGLSAVAWFASRSVPSRGSIDSSWTASAPSATAATSPASATQISSRDSEPSLPVAPDEPVAELELEPNSVDALALETHSNASASQRARAPSGPEAAADGDADPAVVRAHERSALRALAEPSLAGDLAGLVAPARLLVLRSSIARGEPSSAALNAATPSDEDGALAIALWCEAAMDHWIVTDELVIGLRPLANLLVRIQADVARPSALVMACIERAERCGLLDEAARTLVARVRRTHPHLVDVRSFAPFDDGWRAALRGELAERERSRDDAQSARVLAAWSRN